MTEKKVYAVGDKYGDGVVTGVGSNNGNPEYTIAIQDPDNERPVDVGPRVHPAAFTNGPVELAEANQKTYDEAKKESEEADKALADNEADSDDQVKSTDSPKVVREKTVTAGNASASKTPVK